MECQSSVRVAVCIRFAARITSGRIPAPNSSRRRVDVEVCRFEEHVIVAAGSASREGRGQPDLDGVHRTRMNTDTPLILDAVVVHIAVAATTIPSGDSTVVGDEVIIKVLLQREPPGRCTRGTSRAGVAVGAASYQSRVTV